MAKENNSVRTEVAPEPVIPHYVVDTKLTPMAMLLGLINTQNNISLKEEDVVLRDLSWIPEVDMVDEEVTLPDGSTVTLRRDTTVSIDVLTDEVKDDFVTFSYQRIDLENLFSLVSPFIRESDIPLDESGMPVDVAAFWAELLRKYGVNMSDGMFEVFPSGADGIEVSAKMDNPVYAFSFIVKLDASLSSRIRNALLDGFELPPRPTLNALSANVAITPKVEVGKMNAAVYITKHLVGRQADDVSRITSQADLEFSMPIFARFLTESGGKVWSTDAVAPFSLLNAKFISNAKGILIVALDAASNTECFGMLRISFEEPAL